MTPLGLMDARKFQELLREPLGAMRIPMPSLAVCRELCIWMPHEWFDVTPVEPRLSPKVFEKAIALWNALPEAEDFWQKVRDSGEARACATSPAAADAFRAGFDQDITVKFKELRIAIAACEHLIKSPKPYQHDWHDAALNAAKVFMWVIRRSGTNKDAGISPGGPLVRFVMNALDYLEWPKRTEAALVQHLRRAQEAGEWSPKIDWERQNASGTLSTTNDLGHTVQLTNAMMPE